MKKRFQFFVTFISTKYFIQTIFFISLSLVLVQMSKNSRNRIKNNVDHDRDSFKDTRTLDEVVFLFHVIVYKKMTKNLIHIQIYVEEKPMIISAMKDRVRQSRWLKKEKEKFHSFAFYLNGKRLKTRFTRKFMTT